MQYPDPCLFEFMTFADGPSPHHESAGFTFSSSSFPSRQPSKLFLLGTPHLCGRQYDCDPHPPFIMEVCSPHITTNRLPLKKGVGYPALPSFPRVGHRTRRIADIVVFTADEWTSQKCGMPRVPDEGQVRSLLSRLHNDLELRDNEVPPTTVFGRWNGPCPLATEPLAASRR